MAAIVYQTNKKTGVTYVYESTSRWDKEKKQSRSTRKLVGKLDPETKEIIPTNPRKKEKAPSLNAADTEWPTQRKFIGATWLFNAIGNKIGLIDDLKKCFPDNYKQLLSIAYYLILEDRNPLSRFPKWAAMHVHPFQNNIISQRSSELFSSITEKSKHAFFKLQGKRRSENEYWAYDTTSISSYSKCLKQVRYGLNKDHELLEQINVAMLFGQESKLPFYYRKLAGNITDVMTVKNLLSDMNDYGYKKIKLVMDRGFYSSKNINDLYKEHLKFLISGKLSLKFIQEELDKVRDQIRNWGNYNQKYAIYAHSVPIKWNYTQDRPYKQDTITSERRMYLHLYFNPDRALEDEKSFTRLLCVLQNELESGNRIPDHEKQYQKYFELHETPVRGIKITPKQSEIDRVKKNYGYFALLSNDIKDPIGALETYRNKDLVEKAFGDLKERLNFRRLNVSSDLSLDGKLFVEFIALILISYIKNMMSEADLFKKFTLLGLLDELDIIEAFQTPGHDMRLGEMTNQQRTLYEKLGVSPPPRYIESGM